MTIRGAIICWIAVACARGGSPPTASTKAVEAGGMSDPGKLLAGIPGDAAVVVLVEVPDSFEALGTFLDDAAKRELAAEMTAYIVERTGLSLERSRGGAAFLRQGEVAFVVHGVSGQLKGAGDRAALAGLQVTLAQRRDLLIAGGAKAVAAALAVLDGAPGLRTQRPKLAELLMAEGKGAVVAVGVDSASSLDTLGPLRAMGISHGVVSIRAAGMRGVLVGPEAKLRAIAKQIAGALDTLATEANRRKDQAKAGADFLEGLSAIPAAHYIGFLRRAAAPKIAGDTLVVDIAIDLGDPLLTVALVGIMSAVAIPAFMKNARKAKTAEATTNVKRLFDRARAHVEQKGRVLQGRIGPTPPPGSCCPGKCAVDPQRWDDRKWQALGFSMEDPHFYSYAYSGKGDAFAVTAFGDLDCDGVYSTFEMAGKKLGDGSVSGGDGLYKDKELE